MYISSTYLKLKSPWSIFKFFKYNSKVQKQIKQAKGVISIDAKGTSFTTFYTLTTWESKDHMLEFMRSGAHAEAMKHHKSFSKQVIATGFESDHKPTWEEAMSLLREKEQRLT